MDRPEPRRQINVGQRQFLLNRDENKDKTSINGADVEIDKHTAT